MKTRFSSSLLAVVLFSVVVIGSDEGVLAQCEDPPWIVEDYDGIFIRHFHSLMDPPAFWQVWYAPGNAHGPTAGFSYLGNTQFFDQPFLAWQVWEYFHTGEALVPGQWYWYRVYPCGSDGCTSTFCGPVRGRLRNLGTPQNLQATTNRTDGVRLTWDVVEGTGYYAIYRRAPGEASDTRIDMRHGGHMGHQNTYLDIDPPPHDQYVYRVRACSSNQLYCHGFSSQAVGWRRLSAPTSVQASQGTHQGSVRITWNPSTNAPRYEVIRGVDLNSICPGWPKDVGQSLAYFDTSVAGVPLWYRVRACGDLGCSEWSGALEGWAGWPPEPPAGVYASTNLDNRINVSWDESSGADFYQVWRGTASQGPFEKVSGNFWANWWPDYDTDSDVYYYYKMKACKNLQGGDGCSALSASTGSGRRVGGVPQPPINVRASKGTFTDRVRVNWHHTLSGAPLWGYYVYRHTENDPDAAVRVGALGWWGDEHFDDWDAAPDTLYFYWVTADNEYGESVFSQGDSGFRQGGSDVLDIDGNDTVDALTDGLLLLRFMFGFGGPALTAGAVGAGCTNCGPAEVAEHLSAFLPQFDIDGNGSVDALTDGLLILRYLFGFRGDALTEGAVAITGCTRCYAAEIEPRLEELLNP